MRFRPRTVAVVFGGLALLSLATACSGDPTDQTKQIRAILTDGASSANLGGGDSQVGGGDRRVYMDAWHPGAVETYRAGLAGLLHGHGYLLKCPVDDLGQAPAAQGQGVDPRISCRILKGSKVVAAVWMSTTDDGQETLLSAVIG